MNRSNSCRLHFPILFLALAAGLASAQVPNPTPGRQRGGLNGLVLSVTDSSFVIVDPAGNEVPIKIGPGTVYDINRDAASYATAVKLGTRVRVILGSEETAQIVSSSGPTGPMTVAQVKAFLHPTDQEWSALSARITKIQALLAQAADPVLAANAGGRFAGNAMAQAPASQTDAALRAAYFDPATTAADLAKTLKEFREAKAQARTDLAAERKDLTSIVTPRQEALLVIVGILE